MGGQAPIASSLAELAAWPLRDGAIDETLAAWLADRALAHATDPVVRAVLQTIVRDETEHAELAWATVQWALETGGDEVHHALRAVLDGRVPPAARDVPWTAGLAAHGLPDPAEEQARARACIE